MTKLKLNQAVIVEGKYDKIKLQRLLDADIIQTDGFRIFKDKKTAELIKAYADNNGVIIATDSDSAGFKIRNYLRSYIKDDSIINLYIPDIYGKERRKNNPSAEGKLGLEGIPDEILLNLFVKYTSPDLQKPRGANPVITKQTLYEDGLSGCEKSREKRLALIKELSLPEHISPNALLSVLNSLLGYDNYKKLIKKIYKSEVEN